MSLTSSEVLVANLCKRSFLSLWSEANPVAKQGKELCDVAVVCGRDVILFSVKEIAFKDTGKGTVDWERWRRKAVDESVKQLYGADRFLRDRLRLLRSDGTEGLILPPLADRRVHQIAVALGSRGQVPYHQGDFGKGFVHVMDESSLHIVLKELDTITDFVHYLSTKQALLESGVKILMEDNEEDLLALYIHRGRKFPEGQDLWVIAGDIWNGILCKPEWRARKELDRESYVWDRLIETLIKLGDSGQQDTTEARDNLEEGLRAMALENRFSRRILAAGFNEFMREAAAKKVRARIMPSLSNVHYVFLASSRDEDREHRRRELTLRCFIARGRLGSQGDTVVGIATEQYARGQGFSLDACFLWKPTWTAEDQVEFQGIQRDLGYFVNPRKSRATGDEFPHVGPVP